MYYKINVLLKFKVVQTNNTDTNVYVNYKSDFI